MKNHNLRETDRQEGMLMRTKSLDFEVKETKTPGGVGRVKPESLLLWLMRLG